jgi:hypothetical protein
MKDLHDIATKTQYLSRRATGKVRNMVQTLNQYSGVLDVVSQWHPEYSALVWGSIKWLLLIAMNYINLTQRIAAMLRPGFRRPWRRFSGSKSTSKMMLALQQ